MSTEDGRIERISAGQVRDGDRIKAPESRAFYRIEKATLRPGLDSPDDDQVELDAGWGSVRLDLDTTVERENWQVGEADKEVDAHLRLRLDDIHNLSRLANPGVDLDEWSNDELLALDIGYGIAGPLSRETVQEQAEERLINYPLAVEATTVFEVVIGTGGPDDRLIFECDVSQPHMGGDGPYGEVQYEIRRVLYRYSWTGSAKRVLSGEDQETAEKLARRVVPELAE
jgi:hypothetical protein